MISYMVMHFRVDGFMSADKDSKNMATFVNCH